MEIFTVETGATQIVISANKASKGRALSHTATRNNYLRSEAAALKGNNLATIRCVNNANAPFHYFCKCTARYNSSIETHLVNNLQAVASTKTQNS